MNSVSKSDHSIRTDMTVWEKDTTSCVVTDRSIIYWTCAVGPTHYSCHSTSTITFQRLVVPSFDLKLWLDEWWRERWLGDKHAMTGLWKLFAHRKGWKWIYLLESNIFGRDRNCPVPQKNSSFKPVGVSSFDCMI